MASYLPVSQEGFSLEIWKGQKTPGSDTLKRWQELQLVHIKDALEKHPFQRESKWTEAIASGNKIYFENIRQQLTFNAKSGAIKRTMKDMNFMDLKFLIMPFFYLKIMF